MTPLRWALLRPTFTNLRPRLFSSSATSYSDRVNPAADQFTSTDPRVPIKLRMESTSPASDPPICIQTMFRNTVRACPHHKAVAVKRNGEWISWTYEEYYASSRAAARGLLAVGLERQKGVGIMGFNSPEMIFSFLASAFAGGLSCGIYPTSSGESVSYLSNQTPFDVLLVEDNAMLEAILAGRTTAEAFPTLKKIVLMAPGSKGDESKRAITWQEMIDLGESVPESRLDEIEEEQFVNEACMVLFTSGTTGPPKGVMYCHDNLTYSTLITYLNFEYEWNTHSCLSYLPMGHLASIMMDIFLMMKSGGTTYCADRNALRGTLVDNLKEVRPTKLFTVPRIWEKFMERIQEAEHKASWSKKTLLRWAKAKTAEHYDGVLKHGRGHKPALSFLIAHRLVISKIHAALGLDKPLAIEAFGSVSTGAAPIAPSTLSLLKGIGVVPLELYGCSETTGPTAANTRNCIKPTTVGKSFVGMRYKLLNPDANGDGEVATYGRNVFMGYIWEEKKTKEALTDDGEFWMKSGDIGRHDSDGFLTITGRIKELIITAGGENISPIAIEDNIRHELPDVVSNVMAVGDRRKHLTCLITLKVVVDEATAQPTDRLDPAAVAWCEANGVSGLESVADFLNSDKKQLLIDAIQKGIDRANTKAVSNPAKVQKFAVLPAEFSVVGGDLGPTLKLKRFFVMEKYKDLIDSMYE